MPDDLENDSKCFEKKNPDKTTIEVKEALEREMFSLTFLVKMGLTLPSLK